MEINMEIICKWCNKKMSVDEWYKHICVEFKEYFGIDKTSVQLDFGHYTSR